MAEREILFEIAAGMKGVGKSYATKQMAKDYANQLKRPVLIYDINSEYSDFEPLYYDASIENSEERGKYIRKLKRGIGRIVPFFRNGSPMNPEEMYETFITIKDNFRGGLLILEDVNKYEITGSSKAVAGYLATLRHKGVDVIANFQSLSPIPPRLWQNADYIRLHKQVDDIDRYKERIPNFEVAKIGWLIVQNKYLHAAQVIKEGGMLLQDYKLKVSKKNQLSLNEREKIKQLEKEGANDIFYYCYIGLQVATLKGVSKEDFVPACKDYIMRYEKKLLKDTMSLKKLKIDQALDYLANEKSHYLS